MYTYIIYIDCMGMRSFWIPAQLVPLYTTTKTAYSVLCWWISLPSPSAWFVSISSHSSETLLLRSSRLGALALDGALVGIRTWARACTRTQTQTRTRARSLGLVCGCGWCRLLLCCLLCWFSFSSEHMATNDTNNKCYSNNYNNYTDQSCLVKEIPTKNIDRWYILVTINIITFRLGCTILKGNN